MARCIPPIRVGRWTRILTLVRHPLAFLQRLGRPAGHSGRAPSATPYDSGSLKQGPLFRILRALPMNCERIVHSAKTLVDASGQTKTLFL